LTVSILKSFKYCFKPEASKNSPDRNNLSFQKVLTFHPVIKHKENSEQNGGHTIGGKKCEVNFTQVILFYQGVLVDKQQGK
jgi:hypothetical protein